MEPIDAILETEKGSSPSGGIDRQISADDVELPIENSHMIDETNSGEECSNSEDAGDESEVHIRTYPSEMDVTKGLVVVPQVGMSFDNKDDMFEYYKSYARQEGFSVIRKNSSKGGYDEIKYQSYACSRSGKPRISMKHIRRPRPSTKTGCNARLNAVVGEDGRWKITSVVLDHNHVVNPSKSRFYSGNTDVNVVAKRKLRMNDAALTRPKKIYRSVVLAGESENVGYMEKAVKLSKLKLGESIAIEKYLKKRRSDDADFFYDVDLDEKGRLRNVFWADARSRAAYHEFGDVVTFDTTCLVERYDIPLATFVGVNHHGHSILLGCALISFEDTETFTWLFLSWLNCMKNHAPDAIMTDDDKAIRKAVTKVFPNTRHRLCLWCIMKKLPDKLNVYQSYEDIKADFSSVVCDSWTQEEFDVRWDMMIKKFGLQENEWLSRLYGDKHHWAPSYVKNKFWAGMSTTEQIESVHAFFDGYVNSKTSLEQFVQQYERTLKSKVEEEKQEDFDSFNSRIPCITHFDMERQLQEVYTIPKFGEFQEQLRGKLYCKAQSIEVQGGCHRYKVIEDMKINGRRESKTFIVVLNMEEYDANRDDITFECICHLFEFRGIICRHIIAVLLDINMDYLPANYILRRWRKDVKRAYTNVKVSYNDSCSDIEVKRMEVMINKFYQLALKAKHSAKKCKFVLQCLEELDAKLDENDT